MTLVTVAGNPVPPGAQELRIAAADKVELRTVRWIPRDTTRGTVTICQGRAEFIEKYFEVVGELLQRGFAVVAFDWRGQGGSRRLLRSRAKGHITDFRHFQRDLAALETHVLEPFAPKPWYGLGHSMGAAILLEAAHDRVLPFERMLLTGPMINVAPATKPKGAEALAKTLVALRMSGSFIPGGGSKALQAMPFESNPLTADRDRYLRAKAILEQDRSLGIGAPTVGWAHAAFRMFERFAEPGYAEEIRVPTFIVACGREALVDTAATERFASRLKAAHHVVLTASKHEIMMETDALRAQFWAAFDAFIVGTDDGVQRPLRGARRDYAA